MKIKGEVYLILVTNSTLYPSNIILPFLKNTWGKDERVNIIYYQGGENKTFLDIGTGNAFLPKTLLCITKLKSAIGADPFKPNETISAFQPDNTEMNFRMFIKYMQNFGKKNMI